MFPEGFMLLLQRSKSINLEENEIIEKWENKII